VQSDVTDLGARRSDVSADELLSEISIARFNRTKNRPMLIKCGCDPRGIDEIESADDPDALCQIPMRTGHLSVSREFDQHSMQFFVFLCNDFSVKFSL
jgi:hypothetical protein